MSIEAKSLGFWPIWAWGVAFMVGMFGTGALARWFDLSSNWSMVVMIPPMLLLVPLVRASERAHSANCGDSSAIRPYNRRILIGSFAYMIGLFGAIWLDKAYHPAGFLSGLLAMLPTVPIFFMIWAMGRYVLDERDEYLRFRTVAAALIATGLLLALATFWGFLETFGIAAHVPAWAAYPIWALGLAAGQIIVKVRGL